MLPTLRLCVKTVGSVVDPAVDSECETISSGVNACREGVDIAAFKTNDMENWAEHFARQARQAVDLDQSRCEKCSLVELFRQRRSEKNACFALHTFEVSYKPIASLRINDRTNIGVDVAGISDQQFSHSAHQHVEHLVGDVLLNE